MTSSKANQLIIYFSLTLTFQTFVEEKYSQLKADDRLGEIEALQSRNLLSGSYSSCLIDELINTVILPTLSDGEWNIPVDAKEAMRDMLNTTSSDEFVCKLRSLFSGNQFCREFIDGIEQVLEAIEGEGNVVVINMYSNVFKAQQAQQEQTMEQDTDSTSASEI